MHTTRGARLDECRRLERALDALGGKLVRTAVGDRYVVEAMRKGGYAFGGEQSGHLVFLEHATTGDGVIAALQVLAAMLEEGKPLSELAASAMQRVPQVLENATFAARKPLEQMRHTAATIRKAERALGANGRVVVRWSGTEAKLRAMVEGEDERAIAQFAKDILSSARKDLGEAPPSARS